MTLKEKNKHHKELLEELEDVEIDPSYIKENESSYLVDYLYGISDVEDIVNDYLREYDLNNEWIVFYRCILKKGYLGKEYNQFHQINKNIFLIRDEEDFKFWKERNMKEKEKITLNIEEEVESTIEKIENKLKKDNLFIKKETEEEFRKLLKNYLLERKGNPESEEISIYKLDRFLQEKYKKKEILFNKTYFFTEILKINRSKISQIQKKYMKEVR